MKTFLQLSILIASVSVINCFAQTGWEVIPSGTNSNLNSIYFYDYEVGFAVGDSGTVIKSIDSGKTWQTLQTPVFSNLNDIYLFYRDTVEIVGDSGTMLFSTDGGSSWWEGPSFLTDNYYCVIFSDGNGICGGSSQSILWGTYTGTALYWTEVQSGFFGGGFWGTSMLSPEIGFVAGENSIFQPIFGKTTDSGVTWDFTAFYLNNNEGRATGIDFTDVNTGYISARVWNGTGAIAKTTNGGNDWTTTFNANPLWDINFPISGASLNGYAVGESGTILRTFDGGLNWISQQSPTSQRLNGVFFLDPDFGFAVGESGTILRTIDGGVPVELTSFTASITEKHISLSWTTATETNNRGFEILRAIKEDQWENIGFVPGHGTTTEMQKYSFNDDDVTSGKYEYKLKQIDFDGTFEYSQVVEIYIPIVNKFSLEQNYPNPFNPSTTIKFAIPERNFVTIKVYDVLGNEVATLVNEEKPTGEYEVEFSGKELPSGIFFYKLEAGKYSETKKMILVK